MVHIIHFLPIESYPPVQNMVNVFSDAGKQNAFRVFSMAPDTDMPRFTPMDPQVRITRTMRAGRNAGKLRRLWSYINYYVVVLVALFRERPDTVLYIETLSSFPALLYKRIYGKKVRLFIHYHEYVTPGEYRSGMALNRMLHSWEKKFYPSAEWVSHTNADRMGMFQRDIAPVTIAAPKLLANMPPQGWQASPGPVGDPVRLVYCGALGMDSMYLAELVRWVESLEGKCILDLYSINIEDKAAAFLKSHTWKWATLKDPVSYQDLPRIYAKYDVGLILYKGLVPNYVYNAPNKLFEYLACGLDVWFPLEMTGCHPFISTGVYPQVKGLDFSRLGHHDLKELTDRTGLLEQRRDYSATRELQKLQGELFKMAS